MTGTFDFEDGVKLHHNAHKIKYRVMDNGCWECTSHKPTSAGYPGIQKNMKSMDIHRYIFIKLNPDIDVTGKVIMHSCDNRMCVNPQHLSAGTLAENIRDMDNKGRRGVTRGSDNANAKLTETAVSTIKKLAQKGFKPWYLAESFGVTTGNIWRVSQSKAWKHV